MTISPDRYFIIYMSPSGTTRHVARVIEQQLLSAGESITCCDLGRENSCDDILNQIAATNGRSCVFIGSPVYAFHALPQIMTFIDRLPSSGNYAVPFATWGGVTSGIALQEMGAQLTARSYSLLGAAHILTAHSLTWQFSTPLCSDHPNADDDAAIVRLTDTILQKLRSESPKPIEPAVLAYQPDSMIPVMQNMNVAKAGSMLPQRTINRDRCVQCAICKQQCPTGALRLDPYPIFGPECISCYTCMRTCTEQAIAADFSSMEDFLKEKAQNSPEIAETKVFI
ncbi:MAG: hypothetical protein GY868_18860 [Deltaproteobacteria bacterium]|nr:hypothetical protein [Deltaproteobacteria bacterium]